MSEDKIQYVQLEPSAFLTDIDFLMMDAEQRGVYCSIIFCLYCNDGKIELSDNKDITLLSTQTTKLAIISGYNKTGSEWSSLWSKIAHKFQITGNLLTHKRVTEELQRVKDFKLAKSNAGKKGMRKRWGDNTDITKVSKVKLSKDNNPLNPPKGESDFEIFWKLYPKKKSKGQAQKTWDELSESKMLPELAILQDAIAAAKASQDWQRESGQYIPNPATWLNAKGWLDEHKINLKTQKKNLCLVDKLPAKHEIKTGVFLCDTCFELFKNAPNFKLHNGGDIPKIRLEVGQIEQLILKQKAKK